MDILINDICFNANFHSRALSEISDTLNEGVNIAVACSGGADSVFALLAVLDIFKAYRSQIKVIHFNHRTRKGAYSDESFVKALCEKLQVEGFFGRAEREPEKYTEQEFRNMRYDFFSKICSRKNIGIVVQGHHSGDCAETVLMRLSRGANIEGICAPRPISQLGGIKFARPLLNISKTEIVKILSEAGVSWCEDETNNEGVHFRNVIRNNAMPILEETAPNFLRGVRRSQELLLEDLDALGQVFDSIFNTLNPELTTSMKLSEEIVQTRAFLRRAIMKFLSANSLLDSMRANAVDSLLDNIVATVENKTFVPVKVSVGKFILVFNPKTLEVSLGDCSSVDDFCVSVGIGTHTLDNGQTLRVRKITLGSEKRAEILRGENDDSVRAFLDVSCFGDIKKDNLIVRSRQDGDNYAPIGRRTPKKLKELLNAKKVPILKRKSILVVCNKKGEILWVPPIAPADKYKITNSSVALELTLEQ